MDLLNEEGILPYAALSNCSQPEVEDMPEDLFSREQRLHGAIILHIIAGIYCFTLLAVVCNDFFLPSVECIIKALKLSEDVGAATFMSIATSAPEFFVNLIGVFMTHSDVGLGTIVGSSAFNLLGVAALGGLAAAKPIRIDWWPLSRDCIIYSVCVSILIVIIWDNKIYWYEAMILVILYIAYFVFMFSNKKIAKLVKRIVKKFTKNKSVMVDKIDNVENGSQTPIATGYRKSVTFNFMDYGLFKYYENEEEESQGSSSPRRLSMVNSILEEDQVGLCTPPKGSVFLFCWFIYTWPIRLVLTLTLPDCRKYPRVYPLTFIMCIVWIGTNSYMVTWMISTIGKTFGVSDIVMGLTFLAAGGCLPEAISIIILSRKGIGSMGVSNALGANTMDILMCLGLLWFIKAVSESLSGIGYFAIQSYGIGYTILLLLIGVIVLYTTLSVNKYEMSRRSGSVLLLSYIILITFAVLFEIDVFFNVEGPSCS